MRVISASRRTDLPAGYLPWLLNRLRAGFCHVANPFGGKIVRVSLRPEDCHTLVCWTRNPAPLLPHLDFLRAEGYCYYVQVTVTGYPRALEPHAPPVDAVLDALRRLSQAIGPDRVVWRYDPILCSSLTPLEEHPRRFAMLAGALTGITEQCTISFTNFYAKTTRNLAALAPPITWGDPEPAARLQLALTLAEMAAAANIRLAACCEPALAEGGIAAAHCVDPALLQRIRPETPVPGPAPSRPGCGCAASVDIGAYDTCLHGCRYCYATSNHAVAARHAATHDPEDTILFRPAALRGVDLDTLSQRSLGDVNRRDAETQR